MADKQILLTIHFVRLFTDSISKKIGYVVNNMAAILSKERKTGLQISIASLKREIRELVIHHLRATSACILFTSIGLTTCCYDMTYDNSLWLILEIFGKSFIAVRIVFSNDSLTSNLIRFRTRKNCVVNAQITRLSYGVRPWYFCGKKKVNWLMHEQLALWHNALAVGVRDENIDPSMSTYDHIDFWHRYFDLGWPCVYPEIYQYSLARWR